MIKDRSLEDLDRLAGLRVEPLNSGALVNDPELTVPRRDASRIHELPGQLAWFSEHTLHIEPRRFFLALLFTPDGAQNTK